MSDEAIKKTLIIVVSIALALGVIAFIVVFYPAGNTGPAANPLANMAANTASSTATSTVIVLPTSTASSTAATGNPAAGTYASEFSPPYPVNWNDGAEQFSITGASLRQNQLTLTLAIKTGSASECVPLNVRLVKNENGDLQAPDAPQFTFPDTGTCNGAPNETYSESVTFTLDPSTPAPYLLTTGGAANQFFTAATSSSGAVNITLPATSG